MDDTPGRLAGLDAARGLAIIGMMTAHIVLTADEKLVDGRSSILFATIAGMSLGLLTGGIRPAAERRGPVVARVAKRAVVIFALGLALTALEPPLAVILDDYGIWFLAVLPLLVAPTWLVAVAGYAIAVLGPIAVTLLTPAAEALDADQFGLRLLADWFVTGSYPALALTALPVIGLFLARCDLRSTRTRVAMLGGGALAAVIGYGAAQLIPGVTAEAHSASTAELLGSGGLAVAVVGALLLAADGATPAARAVRAVLWPFGAAGSMPLTIYTMHVLGMVAATRIAADAGEGPYDYAWWLLPVMVAGALVVGSALRATLGFGPLERAVAWLSSPRTPAPGSATPG